MSIQKCNDIIQKTADIFPHSKTQRENERIIILVIFLQVAICGIISKLDDAVLHWRVHHKRPATCTSSAASSVLSKQGHNRCKGTITIL